MGSQALQVGFAHAFATPCPLAAEMKCTREEMKAARLPLEYRDYCAHILIPLNECRRQTWFSPWKCTDLRHSYEKCQYDEYQRRVAILKTERPTQFFSSR